MSVNGVKVSIVIPIYNVEKYLRQCLDSVINQTLKEIEIICVNDGSTDSSPDIINEYMEKDNRVKVINKKNSGYGHSMNMGFDMAVGEYIGIVESDDYADLDMFEKLYSCAKKYDLDVVKSGYYLYYSKPIERNISTPIVSYINSQRTFCPVTDFKSKMEMIEFFNIKPTIWSAIYRTRFIRNDNIRFNETPGASFQDSSFNFKVWSLAKRVRLLQECFLHYRQDNEASSINDPGKVYCVCDEYDEMQQFLDKHQLIKAKLEPVMVRIKYDSYYWNYERLAEPLQAEFIQRFHEDFKRHDIDGVLQRQYFEWHKWVKIHQIIENPKKYHDIQVKIKNGELEEEYVWEKQKKRTINGKEVPYFIEKILGGIDCICDHGLKYTIKLFHKKIYRRIKK